MLEHFTFAALCLGLYFLLSFVVAFMRKRLDTVDTVWGGAFIVIAISQVAIRQNDLFYAQVLTTILVVVWGLRLSYHVWMRNFSKSEDARYEAMKSKWRGSVWRQALVRVFLVQAVLAFVVALPIIATATAHSPFNSDLWLTVGFFIWLTGFVTETFADYQLSRFLERGPKKKIMDEGLWRFSRHPNYFGEVLV